MPKYRVIVHRRVHRLLKGIENERQKLAITEAMEKLENYPMSLREMDVATIRGMKKTFRIRVGRYSIFSQLKRLRIQYTLLTLMPERGFIKNREMPVRIVANLNGVFTDIDQD